MKRIIIVGLLLSMMILTGCSTEEGDCYHYQITRLNGEKVLCDYRMWKSGVTSFNECETGESYMKFESYKAISKVCK